MSKPKTRCPWAEKVPLFHEYHDKEWGRPLHADNKLFESFVLSGFQAGLSWLIILRKREAFRKAFDNFEIKKVAGYNEKKIKQLLQNTGIIRNGLKIRSAVNNAKEILKVQREFGSFNRYLWKFVNNRTIDGRRKSEREIPTCSPESDALSADLKKRGFKFCGTTICYAFMQAVGMVNDHTKDCFRYTS